MRKTLLLAAVACLSAGSSPARPSEDTLTLALAGDIMLGRGVKRITDTAGLFYPFAPTCHLLKSADLAVGNLESPLTTAEYLTPSPWKFKGDTSAAALELRRAGFRLLALANNHAPDCGQDGFFDTQRFLDQAGILHGGRGDSFRLALPHPAGFDSGRSYPYCLPAFIEVRGVRIGFLSFCEQYLLEISKDYGGHLIARADSATVVNSIRLIRDQCDLVIASFHWGQEYQDHPNAAQKKMGRLAVRAGADIVHGHHPHVLQGVELYRGGLIAYSLGNFIFDQRHVKPRQSGLLFVKLLKTNRSASVALERGPRAWPSSVALERGPRAESRGSREGVERESREGREGVELSSVRINSVSFVPLEIVKNRPQPASKKGWKAITQRFTEQCRQLGTAVAARGDALLLSPRPKAQGAKKGRPG